MIARVLATFDILPPLDEDGKARMPSEEFTDDLVRYVWCHVLHWGQKRGILYPTFAVSSTGIPCHSSASSNPDLKNWRRLSQKCWRRLNICLVTCLYYNPYITRIAIAVGPCVVCGLALKWPLPKMDDLDRRLLSASRPLFSCDVSPSR